MNDIFDSEDEAVKAGEGRVAGAKTIFCPIIKEDCNTRCVCFIPMGVRKSHTGKWFISGGYCENAMFSGARG